MSAVVPFANVEARARLSQGSTNDVAVYQMVARALGGRHPGGGVLLDVGCGTGNLWPHVCDRFDHYVGVDVVRYEGFPDGATFYPSNLDAADMPLADSSADVVAAVETIEHLENPRALWRELVRLAKPGGWVIVTTPNQLSLLSKLTLVLKNNFNAFQDGSYPAHLTALLEIDLRRMAAECTLTDVAVAYSLLGRIVLTPWHYPWWLSRLFPRGCSDNVLVIGKKPAS
jgi:2-polyprenyl-3-methyl-5-hydroxy-6-metoxy-1,4-benzoquinol methylase